MHIAQLHYFSCSVGAGPCVFLASHYTRYFTEFRVHYVTIKHIQKLVDSYPVTISFRLNTNAVMFPSAECKKVIHANRVIFQFNQKKKMRCQERQCDSEPT